ncbi:hypothetical protein VTK73DRAFT_1799 [Phialemonium thermophilum]|uniref:Uncharacterized protein n=1 Tax=Phialemonium thermophilum TaxID=223376 RepID=A0ABR3VSX8_9PEZI
MTVSQDRLMGAAGPSNRRIRSIKTGFLASAGSARGAALDRQQTATGLETKTDRTERRRGYSTLEPSKKSRKTSSGSNGSQKSCSFRVCQLGVPQSEACGRGEGEGRGSTNRHEIIGGTRGHQREGRLRDSRLALHVSLPTAAQPWVGRISGVQVAVGSV